MRNKIINESADSDDSSSSSSNPEAQPDLMDKEEGSSSHDNKSKKIFDANSIFDPLTAPLNSRNFAQGDPENSVQRKFSVPTEQNNQKREAAAEDVDFKQALLSFKQEAMSQSKENKRKTRKRKGRKR